MIPEGGGPYTASRLWGLDVQLALPCEGMAYQFPFDEIPAVVDWRAREELKCRGRAEVILAHANDGRVGIEAREDRVKEDATSWVLGYAGHVARYLGRLSAEL